MSKPYADLRAQMSPDAQAQAAAQADALLAALPTPGQRAFAVYHQHRYRRAFAAGVPLTNLWQLLPASERDMWEAIAQAVLDTREEATHA